MKNHRSFFAILALFGTFHQGSVANGQVYFNENFENGPITAGPNPDWAWDLTGSVATGVMAIGDRDF